jgi:hypothetical protein
MAPAQRAATMNVVPQTKRRRRRRCERSPATISSSSLLGGGSWRPIAARRCSFSRGRARRRAWAGPLRSELPALSMITTLRPHGSFARARRLPGAACTVPCGSAHVVRKGLQVGIPSCGLADGLGSASGGQGALTATEETRWTAAQTGSGDRGSLRPRHLRVCRALAERGHDDDRTSAAPSDASRIGLEFSSHY